MRRLNKINGILMMTTTTTISIPKDLLESLRARAAEEDRSVSAEVRLAVKAHIATRRRRNNDALNSKGHRERVS